MIFPRWQQGAFDAIRDAIESYISAPQPAAPGHASVADERAKLAELHKSGVLTDAEFTDHKARLLP